MKNTLVVVADLGRLKAFRLENSDETRSPRLELLEEFRNLAANGKLVDKVTDLSGRFTRGGARSAENAMSDGERHNMELEMRKRLVRQMAEHFNSLARGRDVERCFMAASREINNQLLDELEPRVRAKIEKIVPSDLTKVERAELMSYF
jgi:hypothetical protein